MKKKNKKKKEEDSAKIVCTATIKTMKCIHKNKRKDEYRQPVLKAAWMWPLNATCGCFLWPSSCQTYRNSNESFRLFCACDTKCFVLKPVFERRSSSSHRSFVFFLFDTQLSISPKINIHAVWICIIKWSVGHNNNNSSKVHLEKWHLKRTQIESNSFTCLPYTLSPVVHFFDQFFCPHFALFDFLLSYGQAPSFLLLFLLFLLFELSLHTANSIHSRFFIRLKPTFGCRPQRLVNLPSFLQLAFQS